MSNVTIAIPRNRAMSDDTICGYRIDWTTAEGHRGRAERHRAIMQAALHMVEHWKRVARRRAALAMIEGWAADVADTWP